MKHGPRKTLAEYATDANRTAGIVCPDCGCRHFRVVYTRPRDATILRKRECRHCGRQVVTTERLVGGAG